MGYDYYVQSYLVILYYDNQGALSSAKTNIMLKKGYVVSPPEEFSDDNPEIQYIKWKAELKKCIERNIYKKMLYEDSKWIKNTYKKKYSKEVNILCPRMVKLIKVYKDYYAWERN